MSFEIILAEILAVGGQLMVYQRGQYLLQLEEQAFAGGVAVGVHVERPTPDPIPEQSSPTRSLSL